MNDERWVNNTLLIHLIKVLILLYYAHFQTCVDKRVKYYLETY